MAESKTRKRGLWQRFDRPSIAGPLLAFPGTLGLFLFIAIPFLTAVVLSFTDLRMGSPLPTQFVGLQQYERILTDASFQRALLNNILFAVVVVPLQTMIALGLALLLNQQLSGRAFFRTLFFMPVVFPMALVAVVWQLIYAPGPNGLMNSFLHFVSFGAIEPVDVLNNRWLSAEEARHYGLVNHVFAVEIYLDEAVRIAGEIAQRASVAIRMGKECVNAAFELSLNEGLRLERRNFYFLFSTEDQREGMDAFVNKREAQWQGK